MAPDLGEFVNLFVIHVTAFKNSSSGPTAGTPLAYRDLEYLGSPSHLCDAVEILVVTEVVGGAPLSIDPSDQVGFAVTVH